MRTAEKILSLVLMFSAAGAAFGQAAAPEIPENETDVAAVEAAADAAVRRAQIEAETQVAAKILFSDLPRAEKNNALRGIDQRLMSDDAAIVQAQVNANTKAGLTEAFLNKLRGNAIICRSIPNDKGVLAFLCQ